VIVSEAEPLGGQQSERGSSARSAVVNLAWRFNVGCDERFTRQRRLTTGQFKCRCAEEAFEYLLDLIDLTPMPVGIDFNSSRLTVAIRLAATQQVSTTSR
jgi:hypothetical protein